jgi:hypothetical protein
MEETLQKLLADARAAYERMTPEQRADMDRRQKESWVRAEMNWPKPKFKWVDGAKVYESYEDYLND